MRSLALILFAIASCRTAPVEPPAPPQQAAVQVTPPQPQFDPKVVARGA